MSEEIRSALEDFIRELVSQGFETKKDIIDYAIEMIEDEFGKVKNLRKIVVSETEKQIAEYLEIQKTWVTPTDCDRLDLIFNALNEKGIVARQNFACCQNCGMAEMGAELDRLYEFSTPIGYVFYHSQDTERAIESGDLFLAFGSQDDHPEEIGQTIVETIEQYGLKVIWNGSVESRIRIINLDWKKRRLD